MASSTQWTSVLGKLWELVMQRVDSLEKTLMLVKIEGKRKRRWQRMRWLDSITDSMDLNLTKLLFIRKDPDAGKN